MKTRGIGLAAALLGAAGGAVAAQQDVLAQLKMDRDFATGVVMTALESGSYGGSLGLAADVFKAADAKTRARIASAGMAWIKAYMASPAFKSSYADWCASRRPEPPVFEGTPEQEFEKTRAGQNQSLNSDEMKKALASVPPDVRKQMEEAMKAAGTLMKEIDTPEMRKREIEAIRLARADKERAYKEGLKAWTADCQPQNPNGLLARRLKTFLDVSATVDFDAKLERRADNGKMRFVNPAYESKDAHWKVCYRAGREAIGAARAAAQAWLQELGPAAGR